MNWVSTLDSETSKTDPSLSLMSKPKPILGRVQSRLMNYKGSPGKGTIKLNRVTQRAQYPLIKEYSLNHNMKPY